MAKFLFQPKDVDQETSSEVSVMMHSQKMKEMGLPESVIQQKQVRRTADS